MRTLTGTEIVQSVTQALKTNSMNTSCCNQQTMSNQKTVSLSDDQLESRINHLFAAFKGIYPDLYRARFEHGDEAKKLKLLLKRMYARSSRFQRLTDSQISAGIKLMFERCRYIPSPAEFLDLCYEAAAQNQPTWEDAWYECCHNSHRVTEHQWSSSLVAMAGREVGWHNIRSAAGSEVERLRQKYRDVYQNLVDQSITSPGILLLTDYSKESEDMKAIRHGEMEIQQELKAQNIPSSMGASEFFQRINQTLNLDGNHKNTIVPAI